MIVGVLIGAAVAALWIWPVAYPPRGVAAWSAYGAGVCLGLALLLLGVNYL